MAILLSPRCGGGDVAVVVTKVAVWSVMVVALWHSVVTMWPKVGTEWFCGGEVEVVTGRWWCVMADGVWLRGDGGCVVVMMVAVVSGEWR
ncbi:hypothetical protein Tco_0634098 [Tanacetum coccineum]